MATTNDGKYPTGRTPTEFTGYIDRTDLTAKRLFTLPARSIITAVSVYSPAASNADTTASISVGLETGSSTEILSAYDVKTAGTGAGMTYPNGALGGSTASNSVSIGSNPMPIAGKYVEASVGSSSSGGPWQVTIEAITMPGG